MENKIAELTAQAFDDFINYLFCREVCKQEVLTESELVDVQSRLVENWHLFIHPLKGKLTVRDVKNLSVGKLPPYWPLELYHTAKLCGFEPPEPIRPVVKPVRKYVTLVGSRQTPDDVLKLIERLAQALADRGYTGRSGLAPGADKHAYIGAKRSTNFSKVGFVNYLPNATMFNKPEFGWVIPDPAREIYDATRFTKCYGIARGIAESARGGFYGLWDSGIQLHTRNVFQVLGGRLDQRSEGLVCWAEPIGKQGKVSGGTNTAVQIALMYEVPVLNLYYEETRQRVEQWIEDPTKPLF